MTSDKITTIKTNVLDETFGSTLTSWVWTHCSSDTKHVKLCLQCSLHPTIISLLVRNPMDSGLTAPLSLKRAAVDRPTATCVWITVQTTWSWASKLPLHVNYQIIPQDITFQHQVFTSSCHWMKMGYINNIMNKRPFVHSQFRHCRQILYNWIHLQ